MQTSRKTSIRSVSSVDDAFEFVDYTAASGLERCVLAIEEVLVKWGLRDGGFGSFDDGQFTRREIIPVDSHNYSLTYHYHPGTVSESSNSSTSLTQESYMSTFAVDEFLSQSSSISSDTSFHSLHRWTSQRHIIIFGPISSTGSAGFKSTPDSLVDNGTAKLFQSACIIAITNISCALPIFIPTGQLWNNLYTGYQLFKRGDSEIEARFNMTYIPFVPSSYSHLEALIEHFDERIGVRDVVENYETAKTVISGIFTYEYMNWASVQDWRYLGGTSLIEKGEDSEESSIKASSTTLPFGPSKDKDPLRSLILSARFPFTQYNPYMGDEMDALKASHWFLEARFGISQNASTLLSNILRNCVMSWLSDPSNKTVLTPFDPANRLDEDAQEPPQRIIIGAMPEQRVLPSGPNDIGVDSIIDELFNPATYSDMPTTFSHNEKLPVADTTDFSVLTARSLGLHLRYGSSCPYRSLLWNFLLLSLEHLAEMFAVSVMDSLSEIWNEAVREFRLHWESGIIIPGVDFYIASDEELTETSNATNSSTREIGIDLRFNILHQKLAMINCCTTIAQRRNQKSQETNTNKMDSKRSWRSERKESTIEEFPPKKDIRELFGSLAHSKKDEEKVDPLVRLYDRFFVDVDEELKHQNQRKTDTTTIDFSKNVATKSSNASQATISANSSDDELFFDSVDGDIDSNRILPKSLTTTDIQDDSDFGVNNQFNLSNDLVSTQSPPRSLDESYIQLNYPSSMDKNMLTGTSPGPSEVLISQDGDEETSNFDDEDDADDASLEISDENASEGRLRIMTDVMLLETGEPMWIPETQDTPLMTEDMLQQQAEIFENLGTDSDGTKIRAELQSAQLRSDMQAFKAANPRATLADFVRWHSPRDWVSHQDGSSSLSVRMLEPGNLWQNIWNSARRIPVSRQKPLFNNIREGEKALHYLESLSIYEAFGLLLPTMNLIAYDTLVSHPVSSFVRSVAHGVADLGKDLISYPWDELREGQVRFDDLTHAFRNQENIMCRAISLLRKFPNQYKLVDRLLQSTETNVHDGEEREAVCQLYTGSSLDSFPPPQSREFVFYAERPRPTPVCRPSPQRMYVMLKDNEFRVMEMRSVDTVFG